MCNKKVEKQSLANLTCNQPSRFISSACLNRKLDNSNQSKMPVATPKQYEAMLDAAQKGNYAYPAVNVTSITTINAALKAFADSKSDGIIQVSTGGGQFASGLNVNDAAFGAIVLAEATHVLAEKHDVLIALHTDHCHPEKVDAFSNHSLRRRASVSPKARVLSSNHICSTARLSNLMRT